MRAKVTKIRDLLTVLKDLERHVKSPDFLRKGREFKNFALRPRELLANLLICAVGNFDDEENRLTVCTDPHGGDGLVLNQKSGTYMTTEHVFIPMSGDAQSVEARILSAVAHKTRKGAAYAKGKDLVVFSEAVGIWHPNRVANLLRGNHGFETLWVVHLEHASDNGYTYFVSWLEVTGGGDAPVWRVAIDFNFSGWTVERVQ